MNYKVQEYWNLTKDTLKASVTQVYQNFTRNANISWSDELMSAIFDLIEFKLYNVANCYTVFDEVETLPNWHYVISKHIVELITETTSLIQGLKKQGKLARTHGQSSFNPLNNEDIDNAPVNVDNTNFNLAEELLMNTQFILQNSTVLNNLYQELLNDIYLIGKPNND